MGLVSCAEIRGHNDENKSATTDYTVLKGVTAFGDGQ
jgi:hypothetical protein